MGYTAALVNRSSDDISPRIIEMLKTSSSQEAVNYGFASPTNVEYYKNLPEFTSLDGPILLACKSNRPTDYPPQPLLTQTGAMVFNGFLWDTHEPDSLEAANLIETDCIEGIKNIIKSRNGSFTVTAITDLEIVVGRDHIGVYPLYFGENRDLAAVSSNMKMLWRLGLEPKPVTPGTLIKITEDSTQAEVIKTQPKPNESEYSEKTLIKRLDETLKEAAKRTSKGVQRGAVAFSGGIDSVLTAHYLSEAGVQIQLICVGMKDSPDFISAEQAADHLDLPLITIMYAEDELRKDIDMVIRSVEEANPMKIGVGLPLYWVAQTAVQHGITDVYSGNGADELFAGYKKYLDGYLSGKNVENSLYTDVVNSWKNNFDRDTKICMDQGVTLRLPFTYAPLIELGLSVPVSMKINLEYNPKRKVILRKLAKTIELPDEIALKPKKAAQYSSGVSKALRRIAKQEHMNNRDFINFRFREVFKD
jgi:asparagine synthase (glutamine-hydrolysing)